MATTQQGDSQGASSTTSSTTIVQTRQSEYPTLVLRGAPTESRRIRWAENVVDNEALGRLSSKVCCIYHRPHSADESSDESSSSSDSSDSDSDASSDVDDGRARPVGGAKRGRDRRQRRHHHDDDDKSHKQNNGGEGSSKEDGNSRRQHKRNLNAYEKLPRIKQPAAPQSTTSA